MLKHYQKSVIDVAVTWASDVSARGLELVLNHASTSTLLSAWMVHTQQQYKDRYKYMKKYK